MLGTDSKARVFAPSPSRKISPPIGKFARNIGIAVSSLFLVTTLSGRLMAQDGKILASLSGKIGEVTVVDSKKEVGFPPYFNKDGSIPKEYFNGNKLNLPEINGTNTAVVTSNSSIKITFTDKVGSGKTATFDNAGVAIGSVYWMGKLYVLTNQNKLAIIDVVKQDAEIINLTRRLSEVGVDFRKVISGVVFVVVQQNGSYVLGIGAGKSGITSPVDAPVSEPLTQR